MGSIKKQSRINCDWWCFFYCFFFVCVCDIIFVTADQSPTKREAEWGSLQTCNQNKEKKIMIIDKNKTTAQRKKNRFRYAISFYFLFPISLFQWISIPVGRSNWNDCFRVWNWIQSAIRKYPYSFQQILASLKQITEWFEFEGRI